jgi:protease I
MKKIFALILVSGMTMLLAGGVFAQEAAVKKAVFIIADNYFQDDEFAEPLAVLKGEGVSVTVASTTLGEVTGMKGMKITPDMLLKDVNAADFDVVVFIGGSGAVQYINDPVAHKLAQDTVAAKKPLGAICLAPRILTSAGVLSGKKATVYPTEGDKLKEAGVNYTANPVEIDGDIITADGPDSAKGFGEALAAALKGTAHE